MSDSLPPGVVAFDYPLWATRYPEFATTVSEGLARAYFLDAQLTLSNDASSPVSNLVNRLVLLNMLVAHIAKLNSPNNGGLVGRISNASEGSVSVAVDFSSPETAAWLNQTQYGAQFYASTASLRTMHYIPGRQPVFDSPWNLWGAVGR